MDRRYFLHFSYTLFLLVVMSFLNGHLLLSRVNAQEPVANRSAIEILGVDLDNYPQIDVMIDHKGIGIEALNDLTITEGNKLASSPDTTSPKIRVGLLADIYKGLPLETMNKLSDEVFVLQNQPWTWNPLEVALFLPAGPDGSSVRTAGRSFWLNGQTEWVTLHNGMVEYYIGEDEGFKLEASKTALVDLIIDALAHYDRPIHNEDKDVQSVQNHLIVLTDGFDSSSKEKINRVAEIARSKEVQIYLVHYDGIPRKNYVLSELEKSLEGPDILFFSKGNSLETVWQYIAQQPLKGTLTYTTQNRPPFALQVQAGGAKNDVQINRKIPDVVAEITSPSRGERISETETSVTVKLDWGDYPPRKLERIEYFIPGGPTNSIVYNALPNADNEIVFEVSDLLDGNLILTVLIKEKIKDFEKVVTQGRLLVSIPQPAPTAIPMPVPTPTTIWDSMSGFIEVQLIPLIPDTITSNRNITQMRYGLIPLSLIGTFLLAWGAWRRSKNPRQENQVQSFDQTAGTTNPTTRIPFDEHPVAQLTLIQGERSLPALIPIYPDRRTRFGRDHRWADEHLPSRFVSLLQFTIYLDNSDSQPTAIIANFSPANKTRVNDNAIAEGEDDNIEVGSALRSGDIIQFGIFKYQFHFVSHIGAAEYYANEQTSSQVTMP